MKELQPHSLEQEFSAKAGKAIRFLRILWGFESYETFAFTFEFPRAQYWRVETGRFNITLKTLEKLLNIFGLKVDEFLILMIIIDDIENPESLDTMLRTARVLTEIILPAMEDRGKIRIAREKPKRVKNSKKRSRVAP
jgi:hypothetical protein